MPAQLETLRAGCILGPRYDTDGRRISVMSRHTLPDGFTPHPDITEDRYDEHRPQLAPPPRLVGAWYRGEVTWYRFAEGYGEHLERSDQLTAMWDIIHLLHTTSVTLLCIERTPDQCHRRLLAEALQRLEMGLVVEIW